MSREFSREDALVAWAMRPAGSISNLYTTLEHQEEIYKWLQDILLRGYNIGVADEREIWINPCFVCGMDDFSTYVCDGCAAGIAMFDEEIEDEES